MDYRGLDDDQHEAFMDHLESLWDTRMDHEQVEFKEIVDSLPLYSTSWDKNFEFTGETAEQMANNFFKEFAYELFEGVIQDRKDADDFYTTNEYHARLCY